MGGGRDEGRCSCGAELRGCVERLSVALARCGVVASVAAPARRCPGCGAVRVDDGVAARARLAVACALADGGVQTGDALRHIRRSLGLRAVDLARLLGVTPETISHWETDKLPPPRAAFVAVAAMADDAVRGGTTTRDRLALLADGRPYPRAIEVALDAARLVAAPTSPSPAAPSRARATARRRRT